MTHCPHFRHHRRVPIGGLIVHMYAGQVDLLDAIHLLWQGAPTHAAIVAAFEQANEKKHPWTSSGSTVTRYMVYLSELEGCLKVVCRRAKLLSECRRVLASDAMCELCAKVEENIVHTRMDSAKRALDEAYSFLKKLPDGAFATEYPAYTYAAAAIISTKRRRIE